MNKTEDFLQKIKEKYPTYKVFKFTNLNSPMILEDKDGFLYKKKRAYRFLESSISLSNLVYPEKSLTKILKDKGMNFKVVKFLNISKPIFVEDENGLEHKILWRDTYEREYGLSVKSAVDKYKYLIFHFNVTHNNKYRYPIFNYENCHQYIDIECPVHGFFKQKILFHSGGSNCQKCVNEKNGFKDYCEKYSGRDCILYLIKVFNQKDKFIKIGVTVRELKHRYAEKKDYKIEVLNKFNLEACEAYYLEQKILELFKDYKHKPKFHFNGYSECLDISCLDEVLKTIKNENISLLGQSWLPFRVQNT